VLRAWRGEHGDWCPGHGRPAHRAADLTVDHVVPLAAGGAPFEIANTSVLCRSCNSTKGASIESRHRPDGAAVVRPSRIPTSAEARACLESLPELRAKTSDAGRHAIAEAVFERIEVLGPATSPSP
jgi:hypothetical protein